MVDAPTPGRLPSSQLDVPSAPPVPLRWCCIRTWPQAERWAAKNLTHIGYQVFLPMVIARRRDRVVRSMRHTVEVPLFATYLFVRHSPASSWGPIRDAPGVKQLVKAGTQLLYTPDTAVESLRGTLRGVEQFAAVFPPGKPLWRPGTPCSPAAGAFAGHPAVILQVGVENALISLLVFGCLREVIIRQDQLVEREA
jgi:transcription antitermination factor NusG